MLIIHSVVTYIMTVMQRKGKHHTRGSGIQVESGGKYVLYNKRIIQADIINTQSICKLFFHNTWYELCSPVIPATQRLQREHWKVKDCPGHRLPQQPRQPRVMLSQ